MVAVPNFSVTKHPTTWFRLGHRNVTLGTTSMKHRRVVWCKSHLDISNRLGVDH